MRYEIHRLARENIYDSPYYEKSRAPIFPDVDDQTENLFLTRRRHFSIEKRHLTLCVPLQTTGFVYALLKFSS